MKRYIKSNYQSPDPSTLFEGEHDYDNRDLNSYPFYVRYFNEDGLEVDVQVYDTIEEADKWARYAVEMTGGDIYEARVYSQDTNECLEVYER